MYHWDRRSRRFRDESNGQYVAESTITAWRNTARTALENGVTQLTGRLAKGEITVQYWEAQMQSLIQKGVTSDFLVGIGGKNAWTAADKVALGDLLKVQYDYLRAFARQIANGELSEAAIAARARMYVRSANTAYNQAKARAWEIDLPGWPGIGTICLTNCGCDWHISTETTKKVTTVVASWRLGKDDNCATCLDRTHRWRELRFLI